MTRVYVDTSIVIALSDSRDEFHHSSVSFVGDLRNRQIVPSIGPPFLLEVAKASELRDSEAASRLVRTVEEYEIVLTQALGDWLWDLLDQ